LVTGADTRRHADAIAAWSGRIVGTVAIPGEPTVDDVVAGSRIAADARADVVVAIGGGSVIDGAKALAVLACNPGDPLDFIEVIGRGLPPANDPLPVVAVPTTSGTGSEVTRNAVLGSPAHRVKASLRSPRMLPRVALVDPALAIPQPRSLTAASGMDALTQLLEPFVCLRANPLSDGFCREGLARVGRALPRACDDGNDLGARTEMALCSLFGGLALANAGLGAVHGFAGPLGGMFAAPHGALCAALVAPVTRANLSALRARGDGVALARYAEAARRLLRSDAAGPDDLVGWLSALAARLGIPSLASHGIVAADVPEIVRKAAQASSMKANPVALGEPELRGILAEALGS
jgi:alcohol dehydrogenase class IV